MYRKRYRVILKPGVNFVPIEILHYCGILPGRIVNEREISLLCDICDDHEAIMEVLIEEPDIRRHTWCLCCLSCREKYYAEAKKKPLVQST
jgi:hypothetical protein